MSSTRRAKDDSIFHQHRYASSPEFERGLLANLVAKRCALITAAGDRELIWFIQYLSHQPGGLAAMAQAILAKYPDRIQTAQMAAMKLAPGAICQADQVRKIHGDLPWEVTCQFPLRGQTLRDAFSVESFLDDIPESPDAMDRPTSYPATVFLAACANAASSQLEKWLRELCLDPESSLTTGPWYFPRLVETLREYKADFIRRKGAGVVTALGQKLCDALNYTAYGRGLTLMQGEARTGKSFAARAWCEQRPGLARFIEVPPSNDDISFFRAMARGLGLGNFLNYKATEIRERVESVLLAGDILLVLDEAQRLWPQRNLRYGFPGRVVWVMSMANANVPIAMVSTPQFIQSQKAAEKTGWNSAQLTGRISHYEALPGSLSLDDLRAVAKAVLPEAGELVLKALALYAQTSARGLAAIDSIAKRARYAAMGDGRAQATTEDVRKAMQESVIPADSKLQVALAGNKTKPAPLAPAAEIITSEKKRGGETAPEMDSAEAIPAAPRRSVSLDPLATLPGSRRNEEFGAVLNGD